ncbi:unnamed protein product [Allacma fusca]|uniref:Uncharacterized protein n=1 Tax=Allacma fusca TaxID=39272 RepID=A0A8J2P8V6_9HEXA|nr:unnamed protein product [Allacma fusca]
MKDMCEAFGIPPVNPEAPLSASLFLSVMSKVLNSNTALQTRIEALETRATLMEGFKESYDQYSDCVDLKLMNLQKRIDTLEAEPRRRSVVIGGLSVGNLSCNATVKKFLMDQMKLQLPFERAFKLQPAGKRTREDFPPLIKVVFPDQASKTILFKSKNLLKDSPYYIRDDFTAVEREKRKLLTNELKKAENQGEIIKLRGTTLTLDNVKFVVKKGKVTKVAPSHTPMQISYD